MSLEKLENLEFRGGWNLETIDCPLCGGRNFNRLVLEQNIPIVRCGQCSLVFANPRPNAEGLKQFYQDYFPPESASLWQEQMAEIFLKEGLDRVNQLVDGKSRRLLDVGCGMGFFLKLMKEHGWSVDGIEPAPEAAKHARETLGLPIFEGTIEKAVLQDGSYDLVTLWYVLEHVPNPHEIIERCSKLLKPGGVLIIRVPNQNIGIDVCLDRLGLQKYFLMNPPRHLFDWSPKTLGKMLKKYGFSVLSIRNGIPRKTGTWLELLRRYAWYGVFEVLYWMTCGLFVRGSSMTVYARKS